MRRSRPVHHRPRARPRRRSDEVVYVSLGDGATSEGEFWESLNTACRLRLPVLYVVADNGFAISVPVADQSAGADLRARRRLSRSRGGPRRRLRLLRHPCCRREAIDRVRAGEGPVLIHARVVRLDSHSSSDNQAKYRGAADLAADRACDPVKRLRDELIEAGVLDEPRRRRDRRRDPRPRGRGRPAGGRRRKAGPSDGQRPPGRVADDPRAARSRRRRRARSPSARRSAGPCTR